jgi:tape measure domain-containing protein
MAQTSITVSLIDQTRSGFNEINRNLTGLNSTARSLNNTMNGLSTATSAFVNALAVREILTFTNNLQTMDNRLKLVTESQSELNKTFDNLFDVATRTRAPIRETIDLYTKLAQSQDVIGKSGTDLTKIIEAFNLSLSLSGTTGAGASAAILQFAQAMQSGRLNGDEFRTMLEQAPRFLKALSDATGIARGDLKKFASEGLLDSKIVAQALIDALPQLQAEFGRTSMTVGQATTALSNSFTKMMRDFMETSGASEIMVRAIKLIEENLVGVTIALGAFAAALAIGTLIQVVTFAIGGLTVAVKALTTALVFLGGTPLGRVVSLLGLAAGALVAFSGDAKAAEKETGTLSETQKQLANETQKGLKPTDEMQKLMKDLGVSAKGTKDAYQDFILELQQQVELSKLDSKEKQIQQTVYKALAAEAKKFGGDLTRISETRRREIESEVRALSTQVENEKQKTEERKKLADDLRRKQEEYDRFIESSRSKNLEGLAKFTSEVEQVEKDYRAGAIRDEEQFQQVMSAIKENYRRQNYNKAQEILKKQLSDEENYRRELQRITEEYNAGLIDSEETFLILKEGLRSEYGRKYDDMAKKQREDDLNANSRYLKDMAELNRAANAGLIKNQEDYDAIRRKIEKDYREETVREYSNLYGLLTEKIQKFTGLTTKEYGIVRDVIKLTFGVDVEDLIKEFFAASIRYVLGFRTAATGDMNGIGGVINKLFGSGGTAQQDIGIFKSEGEGLLGGFGNIAEGIFGGIGSLIAKVFNGGLDIIMSFVKGAGGLLGKLGSGIGDIFSSIFSSGGGGGGILGSIGDFVSNIPVVGDIIGGIGDFFGGLPGVSDIVGGIKDIFSGGDLFSGIGEIFSGGGGAVGGALGAVAGTAGMFGLVTAIDKLGGGWLGLNEVDRSSAKFQAGLEKSLRASEAASEQERAYMVSDQYKRAAAFQAGETRLKNPLSANPGDFVIRGIPYPAGFSKPSWAGLSRELTNIYGLNVTKDQVPNIYYMAMGGIINRKSMFATTDGFAVAGEAGAEAILPLSRGSNGELGVNAQGMGAVNVNFTINAVDAQGIDQLLIEKKQFITNMVRSAVADRGKIGNFF